MIVQRPLAPIDCGAEGESCVVLSLKMCKRMPADGAFTASFPRWFRHPPWQLVIRINRHPDARKWRIPELPQYNRRPGRCYSCDKYTGRASKESFLGAANLGCRDVSTSVALLASEAMSSAPRRSPGSTTGPFPPSARWHTSAIPGMSFRYLARWDSNAGCRSPDRSRRSSSTRQLMKRS